MRSHADNIRRRQSRQDAYDEALNKRLAEGRAKHQASVKKKEIKDE